MCGAELKTLPEGVQRVAAFLQANGHPDAPVMLDEAARTAQQAADALGVALGQIAKSIVFRRKSDDLAVLVVTSGDRRVDEKKLEALVSPAGKRLGRADAAFVKTRTGFSIGGVSPLAHVGEVKDALLRAMLWGALWDQVREATLPPASFAEAAIRELPLERDEQIAGALTSRLLTATLRYGRGGLRQRSQREVERLLLAGARDTMRAYGQRKSQLDALIGSTSGAFSPARMLDTLDRWLDGDSAAGLPLRAPTRWAIVTRLIAERHPSSRARLQAEMVRDSSSEGRRQAFVAAAAAPDSATKAQYFTRWFGDSTLNEEWVTSSLRAFHDDDQDAITRRYLVPSLDTLPWVQKNRRIFFLGAWLSAAVGGQGSPEALAQVNAWLSANPRLGADLRRKVLQARDELQRTVRIRRTYPTGGPQITARRDQF